MGKKIVLGETPIIQWASLRNGRAAVVCTEDLVETGDWVRRRLRAMNFQVGGTVTVREDEAEIAEALKTLMAENSLIVLVGGVKLGSAPSLSGVSMATGRRLVFSEEALDVVRDYYLFEGGGEGPIPVEAEVLLWLPEESIVLRNPRGAAPGFILEGEGIYIVCLPGPDLEAREVFEEEAEPFLRHLAGLGFSVSFHVMTNVWETPVLVGVAREVGEESPWIFAQVKPNVATRWGRGVTVTVYAEEAEELSKRLEEAMERVVTALAAKGVKVIELHRERGEG